MTARPLYRASVAGLFLLSLIAFVDIFIAVIPILLTHHVPPRATDEGTQAHIFQLSIAALLPVGMVFLATANWSKPLRVVAAVAVPFCVAMAAFALLYYFEHLA